MTTPFPASPLTVERVGAALDGLGSAVSVRSNRIRFTTSPGNIREAVQRTLRDLGCDRFMQMATVDAGANLEIHYLLTGPHRTVVTLVAPVPREAPRAPTVSDLLPPAGIYERQAHDLMGIVFEGHPGLDRLVLNDDWPAGEHPLRKDWKARPGGFYGGIQPGAAAPPCGPGGAVEAARAAAREPAKEA